MTQYQVAPKVIISQQESTGAVNIKVVATRDLEWYLAKAAGDDSGENQNQGNNPSLVSESIFSIFTQKLFKPGTWQPPVDSFVSQVNYNSFPVQKNMIEKLCDEVIKILAGSETVVKVRSPAKIFGNIHGVYGDLMRFFGTHGRSRRDFRRTHGSNRTHE